MKSKPARQVLWRGNSTPGGNERILRGGDGEGYYWDAFDNAVCINGKWQTVGGCFPVDQTFVAEKFKESGREWRWEEDDEVATAEKRALEKQTEIKEKTRKWDIAYKEKLRAERNNRGAAYRNKKK